MTLNPAPPVAVGGSDPAPAVHAGEKTPQPAQPAPASPSQTADVQGSMVSSSQRQPQQLSVSYQLVENGRKVCFKVVDEDTGQVIRQVPPADVLKGEEQLYELLKKQAVHEKA